VFTIFTNSTNFILKSKPHAAWPIHPRYLALALRQLQFLSSWATVKTEGARCWYVV